jgi:two-component system response regulator DctR
MPSNKPLPPIKNGTVHLVEDDVALSNAISMLIQVEGMQAVQHPSGEAFIRHMAQHKTSAAEMTPACILLDVRMGDMSGLEVFDQLNRNYPHLAEPVIFLTGHGDLHMAVDVLKKGAFDFVTKPFISEVLLEQLQRGLTESAKRIDELVFRQETKHLLDNLTDREQLVMTHVVEGLHNKDIAEMLGNSVRTIEIHRANVFDKMKVKSAVELARLVERYASTQ